MTGSPGSRETILERIRAASPPATRPPLGAIQRHHQGPRGPGDPALFAERVAHYRAGVTTTATHDIATAVAAILERLDAHRVVVPDGLPDTWTPAGPQRLTDDPPLSPTDLDTADAVLTTCAVAIADTGTIILDHGPGQGRRALTLVPDRHVVIVPTTHIVTAVPDAIARLDPRRAQTWISGPSATSDIELDRVEGVHGPRTLQVIIAGP